MSVLMENVISLGILTICFIATLSFIVPRLQTNIIFDPRPYDTIHSLPPHVDVTTINTVDGEVLQLAIVAPMRTSQLSSVTSIFFHGRRGNLQTCYHQAALDAHAGMRVVMVDYRGYGKSTGIPSEPGLHLDACAVLQYVEHNLQTPHSQTIIHGYSMGCSVALYIASLHNDFVALILESPFASLTSTTIHMYPYLFPLRRFMSDEFDNTRYMRQLRDTPLYITHSEEDDCISINDARTLFQTYTGREKAFHISQLPSHAGPHLTHHAYEWIERYVRS